MLRLAAPGATFLLNSPYRPDEVWDHLPRAVQQPIIDKKLRFFVIDASKVARDVGLGGRTNTVLQTCFFAISGVLPRDEAIRHIKAIDPQDLRRARARRSSQQNFAAVDGTLARPLRGEGARQRHQHVRSSADRPRDARRISSAT